MLCYAPASLPDSPSLWRSHRTFTIESEQSIIASPSHHHTIARRMSNILQLGSSCVSSPSHEQVCDRESGHWQCPRRGRASQRRAGRRLAAWPRLASVDGHPCTMERLRPAEVGPAGTRTRASPRGWAEVQLVGRRRSCLCRRWMIKTRIRAGRRVAANRRAGAGPRRPMSRMRRPRGTRGHFAFGRPARACCSNSDHDSMAELEAPRAPTMRARRRPPALI